MDLLLIIVIILVILWFTGWRGNWGKGLSNQGLIHILLILAVVILAVWLIQAVVH